MNTLRKEVNTILDADKINNKDSILAALKSFLTPKDAAYFYNQIINGEIDNLKVQDRLFKLNDYLYVINFDEIDYSVGEKYMAEHYRDGLGACSSVRYGKFHGRNFDWKYDDKVEFIVRVSNKASKYRSWGLCSNLIGANKNAVEQMKDLESYEAMPFMIVDGMNEKGVCCNTNVVPKGDKGTTPGTHPNAEKTYCQRMLPRYILDNFATAKEAVEDIRDNINVYAPVMEDFPYELHMMVSDINESYIVEFVNNECVITKVYGTDATYPAIMTNFYAAGTTPAVDGTVVINLDGQPNESGITPNGAGLERHNTAANYIFSHEATEDNMFELMTEKLIYTNAYTITDDNDFWYTEFVESPIAEGSETLTTCSSTKEDYAYAKEMSQLLYANRNRENPWTWQTVHTCLYNLEDKSVILVNQEGLFGGKFKFYI